MAQLAARVGCDFPSIQKCPGDPGSGPQGLLVIREASRRLSPPCDLARFIRRPHRLSCAWPIWHSLADHSTDFLVAAPRHPDSLLDDCYTRSSVYMPWGLPWLLGTIPKCSIYLVPARGIAFGPLPNIPLPALKIHTRCLPADPFGRTGHAASVIAPMWRPCYQRVVQEMAAGNLDSIGGEASR